MTQPNLVLSTDPARQTGNAEVIAPKKTSKLDDVTAAIRIQTFVRKFQQQAPFKNMQAATPGKALENMQPQRTISKDAIPNLMNDLSQSLSSKKIDKYEAEIKEQAETISVLVNTLNEVKADLKYKTRVTLLFSIAILVAALISFRALSTLLNTSTKMNLTLENILMILEYILKYESPP